MKLEIKIQKKGAQYQATESKLNIHAFGDSKAKAIVRLKLIVRFYLDTADEIKGKVRQGSETDGPGEIWNSGRTERETGTGFVFEKDVN